MDSHSGQGESTRKQRIRPRFLDLAEFDDDDFGPGASGAGPNAFGNWPPAATVVRKSAPSVGSSKDGKEPAPSVKAEPAPKATVADDDGVSDSPGPRESGVKGSTGGKNVRFEMQMDERDNAPGTTQQTEQGGIGPSTSSGGSLIGTIQERPVGKGRRNPPQGQKQQSQMKSRFKVGRLMDEDLRRHDEEQSHKQSQLERIEAQSPGTGFPIVSRRDQIEPILPATPAGKGKMRELNEDIASVGSPEVDKLATASAFIAARKSAPGAEEADEWLDEDGRPMSAFRKSRLIRQGLGPPSIRKKSNTTDPTSTTEEGGHDFVPDSTRDPGGGADIDAITAVLADVSKENDRKLQQMSSTEIMEEVSSLESLFPKEVLEALRSRKKVGGSATQKTLTKTAPDTPSANLDTSSVSATQLRGDPMDIKRQYFPSEPEGINPTLEWMMPETNESKKRSSDELRFDFRGQLLRGRTETDETYLSGLHHHGDNQSAPGYTFAELVQLSRSSVAAQRQLALNVLGRICEQHPTFEESRPGSDSEESAPVRDFLNSNTLLPRARTIMIARWLLDDRHFTVRSAALRCLAATLRSLPSGATPMLGVELTVDWRTLLPTDGGADDEQADASEVEHKFQKDWAMTMLDSNILGLFLDRTDSVITSTWEAETALEILYRIASCSASHAERIFKSESDSKRVCDFIVHLGLNVAWPPTHLTSTAVRTGTLEAPASLYAVRLLHLGVLSSRDAAQTMVHDGTIDNLLRFVVSAPWKFESDQSGSDDDLLVLRVYEIFEQVLQIYISLASYGFYAFVVGRTWDLWKEAGSWAASQLHLVTSAGTKVAPSMLDGSRVRAAQSVFELLSAWTRCAKDPHQLMNDHDVTWTQVRDWIDVLPEAVKSLSSLGPEKDATAEAQSTQVASLLGAICQYTECWLDCATQKEAKIIEKQLPHCKILLRHSFSLNQQALDEVLQRSEHDLENIESACVSLRRTLRLLDRLAALQADEVSTTATEIRRDATQLALLLTSTSTVWNSLSSPSAFATGTYVCGDEMTSFVIDSVIRPSHPNGETDLLGLVPVPRLKALYPDTVLKVLRDSVESFLGQEAFQILKPFFTECVKGHDQRKGKQEEETNETTLLLSEVQCLFRPRQSSTDSGTSTARQSRSDQGEEDEGEEEDEDDIDPITGAALWRCSASRLPMRLDWPLLPLDDLLHSANAAVFNKPGNLDPEWSANELEIVQTSLALAVKVFGSLMKRFEQIASSQLQTGEALAILSALPSPEQLLLGVMKVFMLEKDQPDTFTDKDSSGSKRQKQAGVLTGRDLFRDATISSHLTALLDMVDRLVEIRRRRTDNRMSTITLERWTSETFGGDMSFYQFFTDLIGLYDAISFGDPNFARVIMTVVGGGGVGNGVFDGQQSLPTDFRKLAWNDYREIMKSMPTMRCPRWWLLWRDEDVDMLEYYAGFLAGVEEPATQNRSIAYRIAVHHLSQLMQNEDDVSSNKGAKSDDRLRGLVKQVATSCRSTTLRDLLSYSPPEPSDSESFDFTQDDHIYVDFDSTKDGSKLQDKLRLFQDRFGLQLAL